MILVPTSVYTTTGDEVCNEATQAGFDFINELKSIAGYTFQEFQVARNNFYAMVLCSADGYQEQYDSRLTMECYYFFIEIAKDFARG
jgi:hypothetical protein